MILNQSRRRIHQILHFSFHILSLICFFFPANRHVCSVTFAELKKSLNADEMKRKQAVKLALELAVGAFTVLLFLALYLYVHRRRRVPKNGRQNSSSEKKNDVEEDNEEEEEEEEEEEDLIIFQGGESLTACDILEAPGEVIGKTKYSTLYKAELPRIGSVKLLRFMKPVCSVPYEEVADVIELLGIIRHPNLLPLLGFYSGRRGEKLLVYPFHDSVNLSDYLRGNHDSLTWPVICKISINIAKGLDHLHTGLQNPIIHGNLKSKNILLHQTNQPCISDIGLHLLLKPASAQQMLESLANQGYKAPEVTEIRNITVESDIYCLGVIFLELVTGKDPGEETCLPSYTRDAVLGRRISGLYPSNLVLTSEVCDEEKEISSVSVTEELILQFIELSLACCSPSPSLRPDTRQVLRKLQELNL